MEKLLTLYKTIQQNVNYPYFSYKMYLLEVNKWEFLSCMDAVHFEQMETT